MKKILSTILIFILIIGVFFLVEESKKDKMEKVKNDQWGINNLRISELKNKYKLDGTGVSIAVLDTGIDYKHRDLNIKQSINFTKETSTIDKNGHGTQLAGIINSQKNNIGITGISPKSDVYSLKVLNDNKSGDYENVIKGLKWSINHNIDVVLMSLGSLDSNSELEKWIKKANEKGIILISAIGNLGYKEKGDNIAYPAKYNEVISVGAVKKDNKRWSQSSIGSKIDLMAPGKDILTTSLDNKYTFIDGTSIAASFVAASAALLKEYDPTLSNIKIKEALIKTAVPLGKTSEYGNGFINIESAIEYVKKQKTS